MSTAQKKLPCLNRLDEITTSSVYLLKDFATASIVYTVGLTNYEFTIGLVINEKNGKYVPMTLKYKDKSFEHSSAISEVKEIQYRMTGEPEFHTIFITNASAE